MYVFVVKQQENYRRLTFSFYTVNYLHFTRPYCHLPKLELSMRRFNLSFTMCICEKLTYMFMQLGSYANIIFSQIVIYNIVQESVVF